MIRNLGPLMVVLFLGAGPSHAGEFNKKLNLGDAVPAFRALEGVDGKFYGLDSFEKSELLVLAITCNHCPVAVAYEDRIIAFAGKYAQGGGKVGLIAINVNNQKADKLDQMKVRAKKKSFPFPYAYDPSQQIARSLGARVTPEFFVFDKERKLIYMGAMDDNENAAEVKHSFLKDAVESALVGKSAPKGETRARGCTIGYEK